MLPECQQLDMKDIKDPLVHSYRHSKKQKIIYCTATSMSKSLRGLHLKDCQHVRIVIPFFICLTFLATPLGPGCTACLSLLTALTKLVMQQCNLTAVPRSLAALSRLKWLCLSRNRLESVPEGLPWQHLELLHLRGNQLKCVPCDALSKAVQLETVDCGDNLPLQVRGLLCPNSSCHSSLSTSCAVTETHFACRSLLHAL